MSDPFDMPDAGPDDRQQRVEHAYELAEYIRNWEARHISLYERVRGLSHVSEAELDRLVPEVSYWLDLFSWQREAHNK